jgi:hypothetical protein
MRLLERYQSCHTSFILAGDIDAQIAAQMGVRVFTFVIGIAGVHMALVVVIPVILRLFYILHCTSFLPSIIYNLDTPLRLATADIYGLNNR